MSTPGLAGHTVPQFEVRAKRSADLDNVEVQRRLASAYRVLVQAARANRVQKQGKLQHKERPDTN